MATFGDMAVAVGQMVARERNRLAEVEALAARCGVMPEPDLAFVGWRVMIERSAAAARRLEKLAPHEAEIAAQFLAD
jgi:hypothetical protein